MNTPPTPIWPSALATLLASLTWVAVTGSYGRLKDSSSTPYYTAAVNGGSGGIAAWNTSSTAPSSGVVETLMTSSDATILTTGTINTNGTVTVGTNVYTFKMYWDSTASAMVCKSHLT